MTLSREKGQVNAMIRRIVLVLVGLVLFLSASSAHADTILNYQITGPSSFTASFSLPQNPTPSAGNQLGFAFANLPVDVNGTWQNLTVYFYNSIIGQGVGGSSSFSLFAFGQQLYSWSASASTPTMEHGTFYALGAGAGSGLGVYTLSVTDPPSTSTQVPEPAALTLLGFGALAVAGLHLLRRSA
jgi:hypothetical protein